MARILNVISATSSNGGTFTKLKVLMTQTSGHTHYLYHPGFYSNETEILNNMEWCKENGIIADYGIYNRNVFANAWKVSRMIKHYDIDIVHFYFNHEQSFAGLVKLLCPKVSLVRSIVGYDRRLSFFRRFVIRVSLASIPNYIYISNYIKRLYETDYPLLLKKNTTIIYNGPVNVRKPQTHIQDRKKVVLVGGLSERKNSIVLIDAFDIIENEMGRKDIHLYIIGDGPQRGLHEEKIRKYRLNCVNLVGYTNKVAEYLDDCAVYVHPAITEGFGIAVVEAMQMGCPCVVADKGALPELVVDKENGYVIDAYNAKEWARRIVELYDNLTLRMKLGENSKNRAANLFSLSAFVTNHDNYYTKLISQ